MQLQRPDPVLYEHRGIIAKIGFKWGLDVELVPKGVVVSIQLEENPSALVVMGGFSSFDEARERGIELAKIEIDLRLDGEHPPDTAWRNR